MDAFYLIWLVIGAGCIAYGLGAWLKRRKVFASPEARAAYEIERAKIQARRDYK